MLDLNVTLRRDPKRKARLDQARPWIWPLPKIDDLRPTIFDNATDKGRPFLGYDSARVLPRFVPVFAPRDGVIGFAGKVTVTCQGRTHDRHQLWLDHGEEWTTRYGNLEHVFATPTDRYERGRKARVRAGDVLGYACPSPLELQFELWRRDVHGFGPADLTEHLRSWIALPWTEHPDNQIAA
jgi:murein DD-endopeptidase MepM/ murein hydrolase activator NlpD